MLYLRRRLVPWGPGKTSPAVRLGFLLLLFNHFPPSRCMQHILRKHPELHLLCHSAWSGMRAIQALFGGNARRSRLLWMYAGMLFHTLGR